MLLEPFLNRTLFVKCGLENDASLTYFIMEFSFYLSTMTIKLVALFMITIFLLNYYRMHQIIAGKWIKSRVSITMSNWRLIVHLLRKLPEFLLLRRRTEHNYGMV